MQRGREDYEATPEYKSDAYWILLNPLKLMTSLVIMIERVHIAYKK